MKVRKEDVEVVKAYLHYIAKLDEKLQKTLLNDFLRRHVQDVHFDPFVSENAVELLRKRKITSEVLENIKWPWKLPGRGVPENIRPLFTDRAKGKIGSKKIFHFEHNLPANQIVGCLLSLNLTETGIDKKIEAILNKCTLCLITKAEDDLLTKKRWAKKRPEDAYEQLEITLLTRSEACKMLS
jgi:hypothetical protein